MEYRLRRVGGVERHIVPLTRILALPKISEGIRENLWRILDLVDPEELVLALETGVLETEGPSSQGETTQKNLMGWL